MRDQLGDRRAQPRPAARQCITDGRIPGTLVQPRIEREIALVLGPDLRPVAAHAALEVVDSVWHDYQFSLELNTADGSSAAGVALGPPLPLDTLATLPVPLSATARPSRKEPVRQRWANPLRALDWLRHAPRTDPDTLRPGDIVITGDPTAAIPVEPGDTVEAVFGDHAASVRLHRPHR